jgi:hypothetical protein
MLVACEKLLYEGENQMKRVVLAMLVGVVFVCMTAPNAFALTEFRNEFKKKYLDTHKDEAFKKLAKNESCKVCHIDKKKKSVDNMNEYGKQLAKLVEGSAAQRKKDAKDEGGTAAEKVEKEKLIKEILKAFDEVAKMKSEAGDTFGDRIKNGLLPSSTDTPKDDESDA